MVDIDDNNNEVLGFSFEQKSNLIKVLGVGGGGGNAVNHMYETGISQVDFIIANTDNQALAQSKIPTKIQLGPDLTQGLGAGNNPQHGKDAAVASTDIITSTLGDSNVTKMLFVTAGMGGGTGTGAAPVIAKIARDMDILTIGIVTIPFRFEGPKRVKQALAGLNELKQCVDSLLVIDNEKISDMFGDMALSEAFRNADNILTLAAKGIAEIINNPGTVNVDFADVKSVMQNSGVALMGTGTASGEDRAIKAIQQALNSPLLNNNDIRGSKNILCNICSGDAEVKLNELTRINQYVQEISGNRSDLIWGSSTDPALGDNISVTLIATGFDDTVIPNPFEDGSYKPKPSFDVQQSAQKDKAESAESAKSEEESDDTSKVQNDVVETGQSVDLGGDDDTNESENISDDDSDINKPIINDINFKGIDLTSSNIINEYNQTPAYIRKGVKLNIGQYNDDKYQKYPLNED